MTRPGYDSYRGANTITTDQTKLILLVYDFAIRQCKLAKETFPTQDAKLRAVLLKKAQQAITELMASLNMKAGGDIAKNLYRLYDYMNRRLLEANIKKNEQLLDEVVGHLSGLREAWVEAFEKLRKSKSVPATSVGSASSVAMVG